ncbi:MAG: hypothetical protein C3F11_12775 [Methylocystaceae bacterium]|nr:MAG: hypothetical protein C3F11_12775 [Methylocystaceae bacterium]
MPQNLGLTIFAAALGQRARARPFHPFFARNFSARNFSFHRFGSLGKRRSANSIELSKGFLKSPRGIVARTPPRSEFAS